MHSHTRMCCHTHTRPRVHTHEHAHGHTRMRSRSHAMVHAPLCTHIPTFARSLTLPHPPFTLMHLHSHSFTLARSHFVTHSICHALTFARTYSLTHSHSHAFSLTLASIHSHAHTLAPLRIRKHTRTHTPSHAYTCAHTYACIIKHPPTRGHTHIPLHEHTRSYKRLGIFSLLYALPLCNLQRIIFTIYMLHLMHSFSADLVTAPSQLWVGLQPRLLNRGSRICNKIPEGLSSLFCIIKITGRCKQLSIASYTYTYTSKCSMAYRRSTKCKQLSTAFYTYTYTSKCSTAYRRSIKLCKQLSTASYSYTYTRPMEEGS